MLKKLLIKLKYFEIVKYLRNHSALFAKYYTYLGLARKAKKQSILVYTMGKVGSTTIRESIKKQLNDYSVYHIHWLNKNNLNRDKRFNDKFYRRSKEYGIEVNVLPNYLIRGFYLSHKIEKEGVDTGSYKIITLTRDPVARNVSAFFQNLPKFFCYDIDRRLSQLSVDEVVEELSVLFLSEYIDKNRVNFLDSDPLTWFDEELKTVFGIDVYHSSFPRNKGYRIYQKDNISALLIRLENLDECLTPSFEEFLGEHIEIKRLHNTGDQKYSAVYKKFKENIKIPSWYLDKMYSSKYANHFYSPAEISRFREKWKTTENYWDIPYTLKREQMTDYFERELVKTPK